MKHCRITTGRDHVVYAVSMPYLDGYLVCAQFDHTWEEGIQACKRGLLTHTLSSAPSVLFYCIYCLVYYHTLHIILIVYPQQ